MKPVEEAFASTGFRRVVLPGIVVTAGVHPLVAEATTSILSIYSIPPVVLVVAEVLVFGLIISSGLQWIYYVYEGFRLPWVTTFARRLNESKLERRQARRRAIYAGRTFDQLSETDKEEVTRIYEYLSDFPVRLDGQGGVEHYPAGPTRLGNVIATYELYPQSRYGIDGVFYWRHLLNLASDSSRKDFEDQYAFCENLVLTSFSGAIVAALHIAVLIGFALGSCVDPVVLLPFGPTASVWLILLGCIVWYFFYRAALPAHRDASASFRAIVDAVAEKFVQWARSAEAPLPQSDRERIDKLTEYLKALE